MIRIVGALVGYLFYLRCKHNYTRFRRILRLRSDWHVADPSTNLGPWVSKLKPFRVKISIASCAARIGGLRKCILEWIAVGFRFHDCIGRNELLQNEIRAVSRTKSERNRIAESWSLPPNLNILKRLLSLDPTIVVQTTNIPGIGISSNCLYAPRKSLEPIFSFWRNLWFLWIAASRKQTEDGFWHTKTSEL